ncbi:hypothetical protein U1Q18_028516, partial [Sarracenia purpurea var. burkii]
MAFSDDNGARRVGTSPNESMAIAKEEDRLGPNVDGEEDDLNRRQQSERETT